MGQTRAKDLISQLNVLGWGEMTQPKELPPRRRPYALDNAAYLAFKANRPWDERSFIAAAIAAGAAKRLPDFVVAPDIVAGGWRSLEQSNAWLPWLKSLGHTVYLAVQDGMTLDGVVSHLHGYDGVFVGGSKGWKLASAYWWVRVAHTLGKPCHIGRISGRELVRYVKGWGTDSIDSCVPL